MVGLLNSYYWNRTWTFRSRKGIAGTLPTFVLVGIAALIINVVLMHLCLSIWGLPEWAALALATAGSVLWSFSASKYLVFRR